MRTVMMLLAVIVFGSPSLQALCVDSQFNNATWSSVKIQDTTAGSAATFSSASSAIGNPAPGRTTTHTYGAGLLRVAHLSSNCFYTPASQGSLASITYSYDAKLDKGSNQVAYRLLLFQNNTYYIGPLDTLTLDTWKSFGATLTAVDFKAVKGEGPDRPDFSCTGPIIQFGYETSNSAGGNVTTVSHIDNWSASWKLDKPCEGQLPQCPEGSTATVVNGVVYCCASASGGPVTSETAEVCCTKACPLGTVETTVDGVSFCCEKGALDQSKFCCKPKK